MTFGDSSTSIAHAPHTLSHFPRLSRGVALPPGFLNDEPDSRDRAASADSHSRQTAAAGAGSVVATRERRCSSGSTMSRASSLKMRKQQPPGGRAALALPAAFSKTPSGAPHTLPRTHAKKSFASSERDFLEEEPSVSVSADSSSQSQPHPQTPSVSRSRSHSDSDRFRPLTPDGEKVDVAREKVGLNSPQRPPSAQRGPAASKHRRTASALTHAAMNLSYEEALPAEEVARRENLNMNSPRRTPSITMSSRAARGLFLGGADVSGLSEKTLKLFKSKTPAPRLSGGALTQGEVSPIKEDAASAMPHTHAPKGRHVVRRAHTMRVTMSEGAGRHAKTQSHFYGANGARRQLWFGDEDDEDEEGEGADEEAMATAEGEVDTAFASPPVTPTRNSSRCEILQPIAKSPSAPVINTINSLAESLTKSCDAGYFTNTFHHIGHNANPSQGQGDHAAAAAHNGSNSQSLPNTSALLGGQNLQNFVQQQQPPTAASTSARQGTPVNTAPLYHLPMPHAAPHTLSQRPPVSYNAAALQTQPLRPFAQPYTSPIHFLHQQPQLPMPINLPRIAMPTPAAAAATDSVAASTTAIDISGLLTRTSTDASAGIPTRTSTEASDAHCALSPRTSIGIDTSKLEMPAAKVCDEEPGAATPVTVISASSSPAPSPSHSNASVRICDAQGEESDAHVHFGRSRCMSMASAASSPVASACPSTPSISHASSTSSASSIEDADVNADVINSAMDNIPVTISKTKISAKKSKKKKFSLRRLRRKKSSKSVVQKQKDAVKVDGENDEPSVSVLSTSSTKRRSSRFSPTLSPRQVLRSMRSRVGSISLPKSGKITGRPRVGSFTGKVSGRPRVGSLSKLSSLGRGRSFSLSGCASRRKSTVAEEAHLKIRPLSKSKFSDDSSVVSNSQLDNLNDIEGRNMEKKPTKKEKEAAAAAAAAATTPAAVTPATLCRSSASAAPRQPGCSGCGENLLGPQKPEHRGKPTLVLDLDETLVHSSFQEGPHSDFSIDVNLDGQSHKVYVNKRPGVDEFLAKACQKWEIVVFTASLAEYAKPLLEVLDPHHTISAALYREACVPFRGTFVKDLSCLGRAMPRTVLIDNAPHSYLFHPRNSVEILSFYEDQMDSELDRLLFFLNQYLVHVPDVRTRLDGPTKYLDILFEEALRDDSLLDDDEPSASVGAIFQA